MSVSFRPIKMKDPATVVVVEAVDGVYAGFWLLSILQGIAKTRNTFSVLLFFVKNGKRTIICGWPAAAGSKQIGFCLFVFWLLAAGVRGRNSRRFRNYYSHSNLVSVGKKNGTTNNKNHKQINCSTKVTMSNVARPSPAFFFGCCCR